jgi:hypothetical protein
VAATVSEKRSNPLTFRFIDDCINMFQVIVENNILGCPERNLPEAVLSYIGFDENEIIDAIYTFRKSDTQEDSLTKVAAYWLYHHSTRFESTQLLSSDALTELRSYGNVEISRGDYNLTNLIEVNSTLRCGKANPQHESTSSREHFQYEMVDLYRQLNIFSALLSYTTYFEIDSKAENSTDIFKPIELNRESLIARPALITIVNCLLERKVFELLANSIQNRSFGLLDQLTTVFALQPGDRNAALDFAAAIFSALQSEIIRLNKEPLANLQATLFQVSKSTYNWEYNKRKEAIHKTIKTANLCSLDFSILANFFNLFLNTLSQRAEMNQIANEAVEHIDQPDHLNPEDLPF